MSPQTFDPTTIAPPADLFGLSTVAEAMTLFRWAKQSKQSIIEVGVYCGYTTLFLGYGIRNRESKHQQNVQLYCIDSFRALTPVSSSTPAMIELRSRNQLCTFEKFTEQCKQYGVWDIVTPIIDDSCQAWRRGISRPCDLLFIDGDHLQAQRDFRQWSQFLTVGGIVCFHDYSADFPQVTLDVDALVAVGVLSVVERVGSLIVCRLEREPVRPTQAAKLPPLPPLSRTFPRMLYLWWLRWGSPLPSVARFIRYTLLGSVWPAGPHTQALRQADVLWDQQYLGPEKSRIGNVAVVIPCHNYGKYLAEAIESVLGQTVLPREVLVVDDASADDTAAVAKKYADHGVRYLRGEWRSVAAARNAGAMATVAPYLIFLDADDRLAPNYVDACLRIMHDMTIGIVYGDMQEFGERENLVNVPGFDKDLLQRRNYISSHAMIRRQAFETVGGYRELNNAHQDWDIYKRITAFPWRAWKADTAVEYRIHSDSMLQEYSAKKPSYAHRAGLLHEPVTIFTPFAGRVDVFDKYLAALKALEHDPSLIRLHWLDTSGKPEFERLLRDAMATLPFGRVTYTKVPLPALWKQTPEKLIQNRVSGEENARHFYQMAVVFVYNHMLASCDTEFLLTLEDDIAPEPAALKRMLETFREGTVAVVASYPCRFRDCMIVWSEQGRRRVQYKEPGKGTAEVAGSGFGCSLFRASILKRQPIHYNGDGAEGWYDDVAFRFLHGFGNVLCNWDIRVEHMES